MNSPPHQRIKIVLAGDSTVTDEHGWAPGFAHALSVDAECINLARNGRSPKSYRDEGLRTKALATKADYFII